MFFILKDGVILMFKRVFFKFYVVVVMILYFSLKIIRDGIMNVDINIIGNGRLYELFFRIKDVLFIYLFFILERFNFVFFENEMSLFLIFLNLFIIVLDCK